MLGCAHPNEALEGQHSAPVQQFNEDVQHGLVFKQKIYKEHRNLVDFQQISKKKSNEIYVPSNFGDFEDSCLLKVSLDHLAAVRQLAQRGCHLITCWHQSY